MSAGSWPCRAYQMMTRVCGEQGERDGALDGAAGPGAGLAGAEDVAGVGEGLLDFPPGGVPCDQGGGGGVQVGGDQGQRGAGCRGTG